MTAALAVAAFGCGRPSENIEKKVIVLGFDGMDPKLLERLMNEGNLPNFQRLKAMGGFKPLATSQPPQSPVAWSNFITGMDPGGHAIFDFIHRDPKTMIPYLSTSTTETAKWKIRLGNLVIPLSKANVSLLRKGTAFWQILEDHGIPSTINRVPSNFPPAGRSTRSLSGMGTPDILGTYGTFSYYTDESDRNDDVSGGRIYKVTAGDERISAKLYGPANPFRTGDRKSEIEFTVFTDRANSTAKIVVQDEQIILKQGEWSPWVRVSFDTILLAKKISGICRFFLQEVEPRFKLYVTPINIDPENPAMPISTPNGYAAEIDRELGAFYTQGMPEDTKALSAGVLGEDDFLAQAWMVFDEQFELYTHELSRFKGGVLFHYFGMTDQVSHMFWRDMEEGSKKYGDVVPRTYAEMDKVLGSTLEKIDGDTTLIVLSDHGFAPFHRSFNLNTWLKKEGYISLEFESEDAEFFENVNWDRTLAYGLGFNGLYLNLMNREKGGIVIRGAERESILEEITKKLLEIRDPENGSQVIVSVCRPDRDFSGPYVEEAPDLIIGYNRGYRCSSESTLGTFTSEILADNTDKWSGDHLIAAELIPGILLSNKAIASEHPSLRDIAPAILQEFGIAVPHQMTGKSIFSR